MTAITTAEKNKHVILKECDVKVVSIVLAACIKTFYGESSIPIYEKEDGSTDYSTIHFMSKYLSEEKPTWKLRSINYAFIVYAKKCKDKTRVWKEFNLMDNLTEIIEFSSQYINQYGEKN